MKFKDARLLSNEDWHRKLKEETCKECGWTLQNHHEIDVGLCDVCWGLEKYGRERD